MKKTYTFGIIAMAFLSLVGAAACSDNYDTEVKPKQEDLKLYLNGQDKELTLNYGAEADNNIPVSVESNTRWKVGIECEGGWCTADRLTGSGDQSFTLSILENVNKERKAIITVYMVDINGDPIHVDGKTTSLNITLKQAVSDVRLSPSAFAPFEAQGNASQRMTIDANVEWTLEVRYEGDKSTHFISITPADGNMKPGDNGIYTGNKGATFDMSVADNTTAAIRRAFITLRSAVGTYSVEVMQNKPEYAFAASSSDMSEVMKEHSEELSIEIQSSFRWEATAPSWISLETTQGNPETTPVRVNVTVDANKTSTNRTGVITVTPLPTVFEGGVTLDPEKLGVDPVYIPVIQSGGHEAAISVPWLRDGYTQTSATIEFNFYSPFYEITEAGLEWGLADSTERQTVMATPSDPTDSTVSFELTGLTPATRYVARGFVMDPEGHPKYGDWSFPFTTAGRVPGSTDNPTPTR